MPDKKPNEYIILSEKDKSDLAREVNRKMEYGWEPQGGIAVHRDHGFSGEDRFFQAMIKSGRRNEKN